MKRGRVNEGYEYNHLPFYAVSDEAWEESRREVLRDRGLLPRPKKKTIWQKLKGVIFGKCT